MYSLDSRFTRGHYAVTVVGCGGTGGFVAESLCRLLPPRAGLDLVDHDLVEERNLARQNFTYDELGMQKSEALAKRLARRYRRPVAYCTMPVAASAPQLPGIVIGCVDNGPARRDIAESVKHSLATPYGYISWWVDAGNGESYGQVLVGNEAYGRAVFDEEHGVCLALPVPTIQRPELLAEVPPPAPACADIPEQGPTINQAMAAIVLEVVRRLIEGTCPWMQLYLDLEAGHLSSMPATPEAVEKIMGKKRRRRKDKS